MKSCGLHVPDGQHFCSAFGTCDACEQWEPGARKLDEIDATLVEATRLALLAVEVLKDARQRPTEYPRPSVRAATYLRCAAEILGDLSR